MSDKNIVAIYDNHEQAETAINELKNAGFDTTKLSIVGKDYQTEEQVVGYYNIEDRMMTWGRRGAFWGAIWGLLVGGAFFAIPGVGPILAAGPIVVWILGVLEGSVVVGGFSVLGAALSSIGIPRDSVLEYETSLRAGKFLIVAHGTETEINRAKDTLHTAGATQVDVHTGKDAGADTATELTN